MTTVDRPAPYTASEHALLELIDVDEIVRLATDLIEAPSINPGGSEQAAVNILAAACSDLGCTVTLREVAPGRPNLVATLPGGAGPGLMFLGHSDVVPAGPGWSGDPFWVRTIDDRLIGRGATDMKGGLAAIVGAMAALSRLRDRGTTLDGPVRLVCTVDEEEHGLGVRAFVEDPVGARSGGHSFLGCVVAEPTDMDIVRGCRGVSYLRIEVTGRAAHSGRPSDGRSAIDAAARVVEVIRADHARLADAPDPLLGPGTWNVGTISGGQSTSVVASGCRMSVDRRLLPDEDAAGVADRVRTLITAAGIDTDGIGIEVRPIMETPGFVTDADHLLVTAAAGAVADVGPRPEITGWTAACDGGFVHRDLGIPTIVLGPGDLTEQAHRPDESIAIGDLDTAARAYALLASRLLS